MVRKPPIALAKPDLVRLFDESPKRVYSRGELAKILAANRSFWRLPERFTLTEFVSFLLKQTRLKAVRLAFPNRPVARFTWGDADALSVAQSLRADGYFTHFTAMHLHGLTDQIPKTVYFNCEQAISGGGGALTQEGIDRAFKAKCRVSKNVASYRDQTICLLNGRNTGGLGVIAVDVGDGTQVRVTSIERTLIDIVVRPVYSGGVHEVARAFEKARGLFSVNKLVALLKKLNFTYPYHQAIGFYLERAGGYGPAQLDLLREFERQFDFYLAHEMNQTQYVPEWRLFVPKGFQ
ncbi:MAG: hypothetical protein NUV77_05640 [Thermoguttaceae bacterium]|jgi:hypothetical protein|nr:hypothetical protein [Thermoguttaceae bacterium]